MKSIILLYSLIHTKVYTWFFKRQFGSWGKNSYLEAPVKLVDPSLINVGQNVYICEHAWLNTKDCRKDGIATLMIGDGTYIGRFFHINAWQQVIIEDNVLIADRVYISDADHKYKDTETPIRLQGDYFKGAIRLRQGCWLGIGTVILPGVTIGRNSIVSANSVVTKDVPDYAMVAGNPATVIKILKV